MHFNLWIGPYDPKENTDFYTRVRTISQVIDEMLTTWKKYNVTVIILHFVLFNLSRLKLFCC